MSKAELMVETAKLVNDAIEKSGRYKTELSEETGIPYATLNRKLSGKGEFRLSELLLIAEALNVHPSKFTPHIFAKEAA